MLIQNIYGLVVESPVLQTVLLTFLKNLKLLKSFLTATQKNLMDENKKIYHIISGLFLDKSAKFGENQTKLFFLQNFPFFSFLTITQKIFEGSK